MHDASVSRSGQRQGFSLVEVVVALTITVALATAASVAVAGSIRASRERNAFERYHLDLLALRKRARDENVILRICAPPCGRAVTLGFNDNTTSFVEEVLHCSPATGHVPPRFKTTTYGERIIPTPNTSADGVCLYPDGHITSFNGGFNAGFTGFSLTSPTFSSSILVDPATGVITGATGPFPLPFVDNLADRSTHGLPLP